MESIIKTLVKEVLVYHKVSIGLLTELIDQWTPYGKDMPTTKPGERGQRTIGDVKGTKLTIDQMFKALVKQEGLSSQILVDSKGVPIDVKITEK